jgi:2-methylcitrate synthase/citrate synthase II
MNATQEYSPGLEGIIAGITTISQIDSEHSSLVYRGINVHELAEHAYFEETAYLLLYGKLPTQVQLNNFCKEISDNQDIPKEIYAMYRSLPSDINLMEQIRTGISMLAAFDPEHKVNTHEANLRKALRILAKAPVLIVNGYRIRQGKEPVAPKPSLGIAGNILHMLSGGNIVDDFSQKVLDSSMTLYAEHGFNASTFACRVTVSTLSDIYSGIVTGIGTLKGPLHGGANEEAMKMLLEIGTPKEAEDWIRDALVQKKKIMGFGHREYKHGDSRVIYFKDTAKELSREKGNMMWHEIAGIVEKVMREEKNIFPNIDFTTAYVYHLLDIPIDLYTPLFVASRISGWCAHAIEQLDHNRLIRPTCLYEGPQTTSFIPIEKRA